MKHKKIVQAAIKEAFNLKKYLTPREKEKLIWALFNPDEIDNCIYGLSTGNCHSKRANTLIKLCATKIVRRYKMGKATDDDLSDIRYFISNAPMRPYTALETIINTRGFKKYDKNILDFIAGRVDIINLKEVLKN